MCEEEIIISQQYTEINGGRVLKDEEGIIWVIGKFKKSNLKHYTAKRQAEILKSLKPINNKKREIV